GVGREYRFSYTEYEEWPYPLLTSIQANSPGGQAITVKHNGVTVPYKMTYTYTFSDYMSANGYPMLATATYPDGETVYYTVNDNLISLKNIDGYAVEFAFNTANTVISEKVYKENGITSGGQLTINDENAYEKSFVDLNGTKITKQFDMYGRTINTKNENNINDSITRTYSEDYNAQGSVSYSFYNTYEQSYTGEETNLVTNGSFNSDLSGWVISDSSKVKRITGYDCKPNNETPGSLQMSGVRDTAHYAAQLIDVENGVSGDEYRLDYFVINTKHSHMVADLLQLDTIIVEARNNVEGDEAWTNVACVDANPYNENWQKYSYSFDVDFPYNEIRLIISFFDQYGTVRFDDISLVNTYKPPINQVVENENANENIDENTNENTDGNTPTENDDECSCAGCTTQGCPCTENCSETCTEPASNRGYSFENTPQKTYFSITDGVKTMEMEQTVSGNYYSGQKDINGIYTGYNYNQQNGQLNYTYDSNSNITEYSYDAMSRLNKVYNEVNSKQMETSYSYENDRIASITHNDFSYNYEYDDWGNTSVVKTGGQTLVSYSYGDDKELNPKYRDRVNCITYGNGDYTKYSYHNDGSIDKIQSYSADDVLTSEYDYYYDGNGNIEKILNTFENTELEYTDNGMFYKKSGNSTNESLYFVGLDENENHVESFNGLNYTKGESSVSSDSATGETATTSSFISPTKTYFFKTVKDYFGRTKYKDTILRTEEGNGYTGSEKIRDAYE
ncbi:MAG: hypothetical protein J6B74_02490, partial [Ruminococcus sp.]|nr:hypothetical protein [Ruminococcus sp.]